MVDTPFILANMYRAKEAKKQNLLEQMFGGGEDGPMSVYQTGQFKGIIRCYIEKEKEKQDAEIREGMQRLIGLVKEICTIATGDTQNSHHFDSLVKLLDVDQEAKVDSMQTDFLLDFFSD